MLNKLNVALNYFQEHGTAAFLRRLVQEFKPEAVDRHHIDEVGIVIKALDIKHNKGLMIDVGAHYGGTSYPFCNAGWRVYAFEPDSLNRANLIKKVGMFSNITIDDRALSNEEKESVTFYRSQQSTGISGLSAFHSTHTAADTVAVTTLAKVIEQNGIKEIDFLKIDTEGFDKFVLEGLPWQTHAPKVIVTEFEDFKTKPLGYDFDDFATYLTSKGYQVLVSEWKPIVVYGQQHSWSEFKAYPCKLSSERAWGNFIACKDPQTFARVLAVCEEIKRRLH
ncbi:MAG: FkbM family methyltransferase [Burkholderiales bacterium]|nr:FkbM family methyltransferase [Burkholderiales bacterium]